MDYAAATERRPPSARAAFAAPGHFAAVAERRPPSARAAFAAPGHYAAVTESQPPLRCLFFILILILMIKLSYIILFWKPRYS